MSAVGTRWPGTRACKEVLVYNCTWTQRSHGSSFETLLYLIILHGALIDYIYVRLAIRLYHQRAVQPNVFAGVCIPS
jgi:hypothetical protein